MRYHPNFRELIDAYCKSSYVWQVNGQEFTATIGRPVCGLFKQLNGEICWALITAENPQSQLCDKGKNASANAQLLSELAKRGFIAHRARTVDPSRQWPVEMGFFVPGLQPMEALSLAGNYRQNAVITGQLGEPVRLLLALLQPGFSQQGRD